MNSSAEKSPKLIPEMLCASGFRLEPQLGCWIRENLESFGYSDGEEIERRIHDAVASCRDRSLFSEELLPHKTDWASHYHLSPLRANLLRSFESALGGDVLELGCGCGAITRYLGSVARQVIGIEGSPRRAQIAALRCADQPNVAVACSRIETLRMPDASFDAVTLIGVLEYAQVFDTSAHAVERMLATARRLLRPGGVLVVAIENQLGLKYFAGVPEDHTGQAMFGINDAYTDKTVVTFSRLELERRLHEAGFAKLEQHVPLPDYKLPISVLHPSALDLDEREFNIDELLTNSIEADFFSSTAVVFSLERAWPLISRSGLTQDLANSLLYLAFADPNTPSPVEPKFLASHYGVAFRGPYAKKTQFVRHPGGIEVVRSALDPELLPFRSAEAPFVQAYQNESYIQGISVFTTLVSALNRNGWTLLDIEEVVSPWLSWLRTQAEPQSTSSVLPPAFLDATLSNVLLIDGGFVFIDREWQARAPSIAFDLVAFRSLFLAFARITNVAPPRDGVPLKIEELTKLVLARLGISLDESRMRQLWDDIGRLHRQVFGTQWPPYEHLETCSLIVRQDLRVLRESFQALSFTQAKLHSCTAALEATEALSAQRQNTILEHAELIERQRADLATQQTLNAQLQTEVSELRRHIADLATQQTLNAQLQTELSELRKHIAAQDDECRVLRAHNDHLQAELLAIGGQLSRAEANHSALNAQLQGVLNGRSWRVTRPLRSIASLIRRALPER